MAKSTHWTRCTAQKLNGGFCDRQSVPNAPFPICTKHAGQLYSFVRGLIEDDDRETMLDRMAALAEMNQRVDAERTPAVTDLGWVYYVRIGPFIKIGRTIRLAARMGAYPPDSVLLAIEPGGEALEVERLSQFRHLLAQRQEWHHPGPDLLEHINGIRRSQGRPAMKQLVA